MATLPAQGEGFKQKTPQELAAYNAACPKTGSYYARIFKFVHLGTRKEIYAVSGEEKMVNKFRIYMEFLTLPLFVFDQQKGQQPWTCNAESSWSTSDRSNLYKYIKGIYKSDPKIMDDLINGRFDISQLMNQLVMVDTTQNISKKTGQANIKVNNITAPMEIPGYDLTPMRNQKLFNELVIFDIDGFVKKNPTDVQAFSKLYKFEQKMIAETDEFRNAGLRLEDFVSQNTNVPQQGYSVPQGGFQTVQQFPQGQQQAYQPPVYQQPDVEDDLPF